ncbi:MAG: DNA ligase D [Xanthomonadaceae bacterium]|nr:DNA ligase D [Xanthomonadaceae bacterium]
MSLREYARKRRFPESPEPDADLAGLPGTDPIFVVQLHYARARHYDFRLEVDGALKSWAVPKGPSLRAGDKRLAVEVEDHPLSYASFEGDIPDGNYGAGSVAVFDTGLWRPSGDALEALAKGKLDFTLFGDRLRGGWTLVRTRRQGSQTQWLLIKRTDAYTADAEADDLLGNKPPKREVPSARKAPARWRAAALMLEGARDKPVAPGLKPQLAVSAERAPDNDQWLHEVKWDGYRLLVDIEDGRVSLRSRNGLDWTARFPRIARALEALPVTSARLDGELVAVNARGQSDFSGLQRSIEREAHGPLKYVLFDLPALEDIDLRAVPLIERKALLERLLAAGPGDPLVYSSHIVDHGPEAFAASGEQGLEGIISKRVDARYVEARSDTWRKVKHILTDEFVIVGYTQPKGARTGVGALLLATVERGRLRYAGRVGTGFDDAALKRFARSLNGTEVDDAVLELPAHVRLPSSSFHWVAPRLVVEVAFRGLGKEGLLRHASFLRLRVDKTVEELGMTKKETEISSPERVVYANPRTTKGDVADYYRKIAPLMLRDLARRPLSLLRCPDGITGQCFYQKHLGDAEYIYVEDTEGLLELVQMNALEFHPWGATTADPERPDRLVFDLDPGDGVAWKDVVGAARDVRDKLAGAGLESWVRTTGGKGLHVMVPIAPGPDWGEAKEFCETFAKALAEFEPQRYIAVAAKARRKGRIFIDWLRNARGATSVCSWSLRARDGAPVAVPLRWDELGRLRSPAAYDLRKALRRASSLQEDPWDAMRACRQILP